MYKIINPLRLKLPNYLPYHKKLHSKLTHQYDGGISSPLLPNANRLENQRHFPPQLSTPHASLVCLPPKDQPTLAHSPYSSSRERNLEQIVFRLVGWRRERLPLLLKAIRCCINQVLRFHRGIVRLSCTPIRQSRRCYLIRKRICQRSLFR